ncbi:hypothetical protein E4Z98_01275 [Vagococcus xieshaowenii]|uniref:CHY-type domain-containing protein n=1 Tax=Vagococcus xieshaowenii TaxID=2562451 RepID=A0A4Z0D3Q6_9ENTE|nr:hypothetical protein [Vagococcus xieshaowenii]QCA28033.1 hypothetical protein E4Z98_01275 [Vagococcus xieshaowenii]TFZ39985.1 hypothetical protein E4031_08345 [Vagococcus xieshaowenii]
MQLYGLELDEQGRCLHYHQSNDVVALLCKKCQRYYACFKCHNQLEHHLFSPIKKTHPHPVMCGNCRCLLNYSDYQQEKCAHCNHPFNPKCALHTDIYFE